MPNSYQFKKNDVLNLMEQIFRKTNLKRSDYKTPKLFYEALIKEINEDVEKTAHSKKVKSLSDARFFIDNYDNIDLKQKRIGGEYYVSGTLSYINALMIYSGIHIKNYSKKDLEYLSLSGTWTVIFRKPNDPYGLVARSDMNPSENVFQLTLDKKLHEGEWLKNNIIFLEKSDITITLDLKERKQTQFIRGNFMGKLPKYNNNPKMGEVFFIKTEEIPPMPNSTRLALPVIATSLGLLKPKSYQSLYEIYDALNTEKMINFTGFNTLISQKNPKQSSGKWLNLALGISMSFFLWSDKSHQTIVDNILNQKQQYQEQTHRTKKMSTEYSLDSLVSTDVLQKPIHTTPPLDINLLLKETSDYNENETETTNDFEEHLFDLNNRNSSLFDDFHEIKIEKSKPLV